LNKDLVLIGSGIIGLAVTPTPDDVTIVSPLAQFLIGGGLVAVGLLQKGDK
jgi:hypothetical protein